MVKIELHNSNVGADPAPSFPSDAEIALAEELRHELEERLLGQSPSPVPARLDQDH